MKLWFSLLLLIVSFLALSCQDVIDIEVAGGKPVLVVEGWLTNKREMQVVKLYYTRGISDSTGYQPLEGARVILSDNENHKELLKEQAPGRYSFTQIRAITGRTYTLSIDTKDGSYEAVSTVPRLAFNPDTVLYKYQDKSLIYKNAGYYPLICAQESEGKGDYAQIKLYKNGVYQNKSDDLNLFSDEYADGYYIKNLELNIDSPYVRGDLIRAEVWSLNEQAYLFWRDIRSQLHNAQIFAAPFINARSNIKKIKASSNDATGYFGTSVVKFKETRVE
ncbi:DUF4249 domain-containing protein [Arcticibacter tournemirensis]